MGFSKMMELLQVKNNGKIVLCNNGGFYIAVGQDAVLLNRLLKLRVSCFKPKICKIGFPIASLEKYIDMIQQKGYSYIVYYFNKEQVELEVLLEYSGKNKNTITDSNINCFVCKHKMDIAKYFDNIDKSILLTILKKKIKDKEVLWLLEEILFAQPREKGLEIGNYTSQMFANIYLNEIDQYIKHELKVKYYCRYLDDTVLMVKTKQEAKGALEKIKIFLKENLRIRM